VRCFAFCIVAYLDCPNDFAPDDQTLVHFFGRISVSCILKVRVKISVEFLYSQEVVKIMALLTTEEKKLLAKAANLMDELLETLEVIQDKKLVKDLKIALREVEEGRTRPLDELIRELDLEGQI
jgi:hypothetical protein